MLPTALRGARTHDLQAVDVDIRPGEVIAVTGVSGSGKSSQAVDTLYAEGQRRFVESFSSYARQFLERLERPPMDELEPVPAGIAVDRRARSRARVRRWPRWPILRLYSSPHPSLLGGSAACGAPTCPPTVVLARQKVMNAERA